MGRVTDKERNKLFSECKAFINPQREDFGITIVEAMASGRPVIALNQGGAKETVLEGETGIFFDNENPEAIASAIKKFPNIAWSPYKIREYALRFSKSRFKQEVKDFINKKMKEYVL